MFLARDGINIGNGAMLLVGVVSLFLKPKWLGLHAMKRFYKAAAVTGDAAPFGVALDGRPLRTPARALLAVPTRALAEGDCGGMERPG